MLDENPQQLERLRRQVDFGSVGEELSRVARPAGTSRTGMSRCRHSTAPSAPSAAQVLWSVENCLKIAGRWPRTRAHMTITAGTRVDHFNVGELLGAGGMGTVYRAYDPRLQRQVAIKVLAAGFGDDPDRLRRFEQEALAVARLAHPNILAVHDIGTFEGSPYIVTELLEGETLREAMNDRRLSAAQGARLHEAGRSGPRGRTRARDRAPRHQAGEPVRHERRPGQDSRLRHRQADRSRSGVGRELCDVDRARPRSRRNRCLHVARAGAGRSHRLPFGPVQPGRRALRDGRRCLTVPPRHRCRNDDGHPS